jgi:hypothetical protein
VFVLSALAASLFAQTPAKKNDATASAVKAQAPAAQNARKQAEAEAEEGTVMIDSKADQEEPARSAAQSEDPAAEREVNVPGGLPSSYGQCKGVISEAGRNVMIFESQDDGTVYFVQVNLGKSSVSWKLLDRLPRSAD